MALCFAVMALAGVFPGIRSNFDPFRGPGRLLFGFEAVNIGGLGNLWGMLIGGVALGVAQRLGAGVDPGWHALAGDLAFLCVLAVRPRGLFPRRADLFRAARDAVGPWRRLSADRRCRPRRRRDRRAAGDLRRRNSCHQPAHDRGFARSWRQRRGGGLSRLHRTGPDGRERALREPCGRGSRRPAT